MLVRLVLQRICVGVVTVIAVSLIVFLGTSVLPGDAAEVRLGQEATEETLAALRARLGLDRPLPVQYLDWLGRFLAGDFGVSLASGAPVGELIADRWRNTAIVAVLTAAIAVPLSLALGFLAVVWRGRAFDRALTVLTVSLVATPEFFVATCFVAVFVLQLGMGAAVVVGSTAGKGPLELLAHFAYPVATLCFLVCSQMIRMTRAALLNLLSEPYMETAILKGVSRWRLILRHALPNAVGPILNVIAINLAYLVSGVVVVEVFFGYSGLAVLMVQAVQTRDFVVVQTIGMLFCTTYVLLMLAADIAAILSNPRLRHPR